MTEQQSSVNRNTIEVSKSHPCPHCGGTKWCYVLPDGNMSVCKRGSEPGTGWYATGKSDKDGALYYATIESREAWKATKKAKSGGEIVSSITYEYRVASDMPNGEFFTHLGRTGQGLYGIEVIRRNYKSGGKDIRQRSGEPWADKSAWKWKVLPEWREKIPPFFSEGSYYSLLRAFQNAPSKAIKDALENSSRSHFFVVEGEKCASSFSGKGVALCNYGGGGKGKWKESDAQFLISMFKYQGQGNEFVERPDWQELCPTLVLTPDRDKPGLDHMFEVYQSLVAAGYPLKKIRWFFCYNERNWYDLKLSGGLDIADMFDENPDLTVEQLLSKVKTTEECPWLEKYFRTGEPENSSSPLTEIDGHEPLFAKLFTEDSVANVEWFVEDLLPVSYSVVLSGQSGVGKSVSTVDLAEAVASGGTWLGKQCRQGKVLILNNDQSAQVLKRMLKIRLTDAGMDNVAIDQGWVADEEGLKYLRKWMGKYGFSLVIMDSVRECICHPLGISQNDEETGYKLKQIAEIVTATGACFIALHHENKSKESRGTEKASGSTSIISNVDAHWRLSATADSILLSMPKTRGYQPCEIDYRIDFASGCCIPTNRLSSEAKHPTSRYVETKEASTQDRVLAYLEQADDGVSKAELVKELGEKETTIKVALKRLSDEGLIESYQNPENPRFKLYRAVEP